MFKHILVPVDGSNTSMLAVSKAAGLAKTFGSAVTAVYVVDPYPFTGVGADFAYGQAQYINAATSVRCVNTPGNQQSPINFQTVAAANQYWRHLEAATS